MLTVLTRREIQPRRPDCLAVDAGSGEPVSPVTPCFPVIFTKTGDFPPSGTISGQYCVQFCGGVCVARFWLAFRRLHSEQKSRFDLDVIIGHPEGWRFRCTEESRPA